MKILFIALVIMLFAFMFFTVWDSRSHPTVCAESATIKSIILVNRSSLIVQLDNGKIIDLNRINGAVGDNVCLRYERK